MVPRSIAPSRMIRIGPRTSITVDGRPAGGRSSINDQIERVAKAVLDLFGRRGRRHAFTICTRAGHRPDSTQEINQRLPGAETDADRASPSSHRIGESNRCGKNDGERPGPEGIHEHGGRMGNASNERPQLSPRLRSARESVSPPTAF